MRLMGSVGAALAAGMVGMGLSAHRKESDSAIRIGKDGDYIPEGCFRSIAETKKILEEFAPEFEAFLCRPPSEFELNYLFNMIIRSEAYDRHYLLDTLGRARRDYEKQEKRKVKSGVAPWSDEAVITRQQRRQRDRLLAKGRSV